MMTDIMPNEGAIETIVGFVRERFPAVAEGPVDATTPLLAGGRLDSLGILELMMFLGETFGIEFGEDDFVPDNFATIGDVARLVERKRTA